MKTKLLFTAVSLFAAAHTASAVDIYKTGFENPPFVVGNPLLGQNGWDTDRVHLFFLSIDAAKITDHTARNGSQSVEVRGEDMSVVPQVQPEFNAVGSYRKPFTYTVTDRQPIVKLEADIKIETKYPLPPTANDFFCATITPRLAGTSTGPNPNGVTLGEAGICSNGTATGVKFGANPSNAPADFIRRGIRLNQWHHLAEFVNFANYTITYTVDDHLIHVTTIPRTGIDTRELIRAAMVVYVRPTGGIKDDYTARFDNFKVSANHDYCD